MSELNGRSYEGESEPTLRELIRGLHSKMDDHMRKTDRINNILFGDKEGGIEGLANKVNRHDKYIRNDKIVKYIGAGAMTAGGTGLGFWEQIKGWLLK